jgi:branched-chain amino acid transport system substrate-binding protein
VNGRKVTYVWRDDQASPSINSTAARALVDGEKVFGIIEMPSASAGSVNQLASENIPVTGLASDPTWVGHPNMFSWFYLGQGSSTVWGDFFRQAGASRAAMIAISANKSNTDFSSQFEVSLLSRGVQIVRTFQVAEATTDYRTVAQQMKAANVDSIGGVLLPDAAAELIPAARALGINLKVVVLPLGYDGATLAKYGRQLAGAYVSTAARPMEQPTAAQQAFLNAMATYAPEIQPAIQDSAVDGWISADMFLRGLQAAGPCPTRQSFISGLRAVRNYDEGGFASSPVDLSQNYKVANPCYYVVQFNAAGTGYNDIPAPGGGLAHCGQVITSDQMSRILAGYTG